MNPNSSIVDIQRDYTRDGFVHLAGFFNSKEIEEIRRELDRFINTLIKTMPREHVFYESKDDPSTLKQLQHMESYSNYFNELSMQGRIPDLAASLLDSVPIHKNLQYFNKSPSANSPTPPHQDGHYFMIEPCEAVTLWLALDEADENTGCVRYIRGSHRLGIMEHQRTNTLGFSQGLANYRDFGEEMEEVSLPSLPGDLLAHHAATIHRADQNLTKNRSRRALGFIYYSEEATENRAGHEAYQQRLRRELKENKRI